jgi:plastocyanin
MRIKLVATALAMALLAGACGSNDTGGGAESTASSPSAGSPSSGGDTHYGTGGGYGTGSPSKSSGGGGPIALTVTQSNFAFAPATVNVTSGDTIEIENGTPSTPHTFTVTGHSIDVTVDPGSPQNVTIDLPAGSYAFECRFHASAGMKGTLVVS